MTFLKSIAAGALLLVFGFASQALAASHQITIQLKDGPVVIQLRPDLAPQHVKRIEELAAKGAYDNVAFHRVIE
eukprot:gene47125-63862_t